MRSVKVFFILMAVLPVWAFAQTVTNKAAPKQPTKTGTRTTASGEDASNTKAAPTWLASGKTEGSKGEKNNYGDVKRILSRLKLPDSEVDPLSKRILIKDLAKKKIDIKNWNDVRVYLLKNPQMGYDLIYKWDKIRPKDVTEDLKETEINEKLDKADEFMLSEKFDSAFKLYQEVALEIKKELKKGKKENNFLYESAVHSMARALFGAGRYNEATEVYGWIPSDYPRFRQVLFEKMWAAFRGGRLDISLGAIASQQSSYFSNYIEPETYLVKIYIFKKFCLDDDVKHLRKEIDDVRKKIETNNVSFYNDWVRSDIEIQSIHNLTKILPNSDSRGSVKPLDRKKEIDTITDLLKNKYDIDIKRIKKDLENITAYSFIALGSKDFAFVKHQEFNREALLEKGDEIWPAFDSEDWLDEMGGHVFIGESLCQNKAEK